MWLGPILWYLIVSAVGAVAFPLVVYFFPSLPDRGYTLSRTIGLLLWGYLFWLLSSLGALDNSVGGHLVALSLLAAASVWAWRRIDREAIFQRLKEQRKMVLTTEVLFLLAFVFLVLLRGMEPAAFGTEKPMELAFINAVMRSPQMPPLDPWLADYAISYYYFGYVMVGILARFSGVSAGVSFNLGISMVFAMAAVGAYGVVYNLLAAYQPERKARLTALPLLGPLFLLVLSNVEGFLEFLHGRGVFWERMADGSWSSSFWSWLNMENLRNPPPGNTAPGELRFWWWWRASRVLADYDFFGNFREVIDEFPFFSYFLADLHPHVLAMPFAFAALALGLNMFLKRKESEGLNGNFRLFGMEFAITRREFLLGVIVFGGLGFLNIWDFPWYVAIYAGAHMIRRADQSGWSWTRVGEFLTLVVAFGVAGVLAYLPFYISFSSQAGGILPNVINPTRGIQLWIMFGTLLVPVLIFLCYLATRRREKGSILRGFLLTIFLVVLLFGMSLAFTYALGRVFVQFEGGNPLLELYSAPSVEALVREGLSRRVATIGSIITLVLVLGAAVGVLFPGRKSVEESTGREETLPDSHRFVVVLVVFGGLLVLVPEFFYLRDLFGTRMNTIFKFYYQAWILWAVAGAYGSAVLLTLPPRRKRLQFLFGAVFVVVLFVGLTYPAMAVNTRVSSFRAQPEPALELDGTANNFYLNPDEHVAVDWLKKAPIGTLVEAAHPDPNGGSYTHYSRISMHSGQPAVIGWIGHERQWRGGDEEIGTRQNDIARLYSTGDWQEASAIIEKYGIVYVFVGSLEKTTYEVNEEKFNRHLTPVFQQGSVTIYQTGKSLD